MLFFGFCIVTGGLVGQINAGCNTGTVSQDQTICLGGDAGTLSISGVDAGAGLQWQSSPDGSTFADVVGETGSSYAPGSITNSTYYRVRVSEGTSGTACTDANSSSILITVSVPPEGPTGITVANDIVCNGTAVTLTAEGGVTGTNSEYEWGTGTIGSNIISGSTASEYTSGSLTSDTQFWVRRKDTLVCGNITNAASVQIQVLPVPTIALSEIGELCQLSGQPVLIENTTLPHSLNPILNVNWQTVPGSAGAVEDLSQGDSHEILLNLGTASPGNRTFEITQLYFQSYNCQITTGLPSESFNVKVRPSASIGSIQDEDVTGNGFCQDFGPVSVNVVTLPVNEDIVWEASYLDPNMTSVDVGSIASFNLDNSIVGNHVVTIDSIAYNDGLACKFNPADFGAQYTYTETVAIKQTPPAVTFVNGTPSILQFCDYTNPLVVDSVARIEDLDVWADNGDGYDIKWKSSNDNSAANLNNISLDNGGAYYPVFELDGCHSKLNSSSLSLIIDLMPLPDLLQSSLQFPQSICSGTPFDILFNPGENISHFGISDFNFNPPLNSPNIANDVSYPNISGSNFTISNSSTTADSWTANIYAQNKNVSEINPVICWAQPIPIEISVTPNATFTPSTSKFESCQDGPSFTIDPGWNGIGEVEWDDPLGLPASHTINATTKIITVDMNAQEVPPGVYPIHISGGYPDSNCEVDTTFNVIIYDTPQIETRILDVDGTICHNEYTHIEVVNPQPGHLYQWTCVGCENDPHEGSYFLAHWSNPEPEGSTWNDLPATYSITAIDTTTDKQCTNAKSTNVNILADYASCPEGIDFFLPNGLSIVDDPALYFQWYDVASEGVFNAIPGATNQTFFPNDELQGCDSSKYVVATSLYPDRCWTTTVNCFQEFGMRTCDGPKSKANSRRFLLYPNPVVGNDVVLENLSKDLKGRYTIEVIDITGKKLMSDIIEIEMVGQIRIALPPVDHGVYLLRVSNARHSETFKIIIN